MRHHPGFSPLAVSADSFYGPRLIHAQADMLTETEFYAQADHALARFLDLLEAADAAGALECELEQGALSIALPGGKQYLISKHAASRQLWVASPLTGGLHFSHAGGEWVLPDGRTLEQVLRAELASLAGIPL